MSLTRSQRVITIQPGERLHVLIDQLVFDEPSYHAQQWMSLGMADALNRAYSEEGVSLRWEEAKEA